jgi:hypothetical protein
MRMTGREALRGAEVALWEGFQQQEINVALMSATL